MSHGNTIAGYISWYSVSAAGAAQRVPKIPADKHQYLFNILTVIISNSVLSHASSLCAHPSRIRLTKKGIRASFVLVGNRDESTEIWLLFFFLRLIRVAF